MIGESVTATMPGHDDRGGEREGEFLEQHAGKAREKADRRVDGRKRDRHRDDRSEELTGADERGLGAAHAVAHVARDVLDDDDGVIDDQGRPTARSPAASEG